MRMVILLVVILVLKPQMATAQGTDLTTLGRLQDETVMPVAVTFDKTQSRGVFIGINQYTSINGTNPPNLKSCVNDAVDLAVTFMDLGLINGPGIILAISGEPSKPESVQALNRLLDAGAVRLRDAHRDTISEAVYSAAEAAGADGIFFVTWSAHGFEAGGIQYLASADFSSATDRLSSAEIQAAGLAESKIAAIADSSPAQRRVLLFDSSRDKRAVPASVPDLIAGAVGTVSISAVTTGELGLDGTRNGQIAGRLLEYLDRAAELEAPKILEASSHEDLREGDRDESQHIAFEFFREAKRVDIIAPREERMLDTIGVGTFEDALLTTAGPTLARQASFLLDTPEKRADFRNRQSFAVVWTEANVSIAQPPSGQIPTNQPTPRPTPISLGIDELLAFQDNAKTEWEKLQRLDALENIGAAEKVRYYTTYITQFEQANYMLKDARKRQKYWAEWTPPTPTPQAQRSSDGRYIKAYNGVITDTRTNLQWIVGPDKDIEYEDSVTWVQNCSIDDGGWRMPSRQELQDLYDDKARKNIDPLFSLGGWWVWGQEGDPPTKSGFIFRGDIESWRAPTYYPRVFGVRASPRI